MSRVTCISWTLTNSNNFHILWSCVQRLSPTSAFNFLWANLIFLLLSYLSITRKICLCPKLGQIADGMTLVKSLQRIFFFFFLFVCEFWYAFNQIWVGPKWWSDFVSCNIIHVVSTTLLEIFWSWALPCRTLVLVLCLMKKKPAT